MSSNSKFNVISLCKHRRKYTPEKEADISEDNQKQFDILIGEPPRQTFDYVEQEAAMDDFEEEEAAQEADHVVDPLYRIIDGAGRLRNTNFRWPIYRGKEADGKVLSGVETEKKAGGIAG